MSDSVYMEEFMEEFATGMSGLNFASNAWSTIAGILSYVFMAIGMYAIAKRRGIRNPWLAWLPFGSTWLLGCISDQYRYVAMGQEKSRRKVMLGLDIAVSASGVVAIVLMVVAIVNIITRIRVHTNEWNAVLAEIMAMLVPALILCFVMLGLAIALTVLQYMALYDLFRSCNPNTATVFLVLSIVLSLVGVGGVLMGIFVFVSRNKDLGMPPRQDQMIYGQPVFQPQPPVYQPPMWQPQQPPVEPWEQNNENV